MESNCFECIVEWLELPMEHSNTVVEEGRCMGSQMELEYTMWGSLEYGFGRCSRNSELELGYRRCLKLEVELVDSIELNFSQNEASACRRRAFL